MGIAVTDGKMLPVSGGASMRIDASGGVETLSPPGGAVYALVRAIDAVEWRDDGVALVSGAGMPLAAGESLWYTGTLSDFQVLGGEIAVAYYDQLP